MRLKLDGVTVSFGENVVLDKIDFEVNGKDKVAIVGRNGSGKTTLLRVITGQQEVDVDEGGVANKIQKTGNYEIGFLKQIAFSDDSVLMEDELLKVFQPIITLKEKIANLEEKMAAGLAGKEAEKYEDLLIEYGRMGGYTYLKELNMALKKFGFVDADKAKKLSEFSGGQRTKLALIKLLLSKPDLLILDEPTNHLDITSIRWLEEYLAAYPKAVIVVSHDRALLDKFVNVVYEIERHKMKKYIGNYTEFQRKKAEDYEKSVKEYEAKRNEKARLQALADRFRYKATKASMAQSKLKLIEKMGEQESPMAADNKSFYAITKPAIESGNEVLEAREVEIGYEKVLSKLSFKVMKGDKIGIVGGNGLGKSTLLKTLVGKTPLLGGKIIFGTNVDMGYFDQQVASNNIISETVLESYQKAFPEETTEAARTALGAFMFSGDDVFKNLKDLSGGELVRLELCKIFRRKPNFLVLDEPTNHMDILGKEALEKMLEKYEGTLLFVSHDRYFVNKLAKSLIVFEGGSAKFLKDMSYSEYEKIMQEKLDDSENASGAEITKAKDEKPKVNEYQLNKEKARKENKRKKIEKEIEKIEDEIKTLENSFEDEAICSDYVKLVELQKSIDEKKAQVDKLTEEWLNLE